MKMTVEQCLLFQLSSHVRASEEMQGHFEKVHPLAFLCSLRYLEMVVQAGCCRCAKRQFLTNVISELPWQLDNWKLLDLKASIECP